jgi:hypothetical protein
MAQHDPDMILWWLRHRVDADAVPERQTAIELAMADDRASTRRWLLVARGTEPELCLEDPQLSEERYVYVEAGAADLYPLARGLRDWADALADRSVRVYGEPQLAVALPGWFIGREATDPSADAPRGRPATAA